MKIKQTVFELIDISHAPNSLWNRRVGRVIVFLIVASVVAIILESFEELRLQYGQLFSVFEVITVIIFSIEYLLRLWTADLKYPALSKAAARWRFVLSPMGLIDLIAILPFYLPLLIRFDMRFMRMLRIFRLLRIFKLGRHSKSLVIINQIITEKRSELFLSVFVTLILLLLSATIMYNLEYQAQPDSFPDIISTLWWAVATLTTVGYGDVYPITGWGKFIGGIIALLGVGLVAIPTGIISAAFIEALEREKIQKKQEENTFNYCPHCGKPLREHM